MSVNNVQFAIASHILTVLAYCPNGHANSKELAVSLRAHPTFIRKTISRLGKAGLLVATRGVTGTCVLARPPEQISLLDIYRASGASPVFSVHAYPIENGCDVSINIKDRMDDVLKVTQASFEEKLGTMTLCDLMPSTLQTTLRERANV
ncbi:Rrf2 family transcriptional regulator [Pseudomonas sp. NA-150]|uniref:Rrf2 family transcriptional regulator n=1 Tax=Pseudomonas sp. NA-150 TaxID=3367525 RepID=UPI0037CC8A14